MARIRVTTAQNAQTNADIKKKIQTLGEELSAAIKAHQKSSDDVRKFQQQKEESSDNMGRLSYVKGMTRTAYAALKKQVKKQREIHENIVNQLEKALEVEKSAKDAMEEAEAE
ncbi:Protein CBG07793 [Caenorhabditis briggsae]|uniref:Protein CBG07793 n=2 Tax=Caenorhabditis briggsae TaxID=6238 RepID=A8X428_CAEBR|nr:Protein CBG07793 [Caenorhabditis briggsae]ULT84315.1 hypothetical protein L3Y34_013177 [Caenorhabditis briggsae]CAP27388.1 Protein CBG07793 [Caenorhabditis briggsae]